MKINLKDMFDIQRNLNEDIFKTQNKTFSEIYERSHLALMCELMELANETRCFNYWSKKTRGHDDDILEEFADVLCFIFSECIFYGLDKEPEIYLEDNLLIKQDNINLTKKFLYLISLYSKIKDKSTCLEFLSNLLILGYELGYNFKQIKEAYEKKCIKNHKVQESFRGE